MTKSSRPAFSAQSDASGRGRGKSRDNEAGLWHRPELMNIAADILLLIASVLIGYAAVKAVLRLPVFGLRELVVVSPLGQVTAAQLEYAATSSMRGNFFTVDLEAARQNFEKLPWVRSAQLRRVWPASVEVALEEHQAVAYWNAPDASETRLLNSHGELFDAASNASLPVFSGPVDLASQILERYRSFEALFREQGRTVSGVAMTGRQAWQLRLDNGMQIELGRDQLKSPIDQRLKRFIAAYPQAQEKLAAPILVADLRYPSGFAVRLGAVQKDKQEKQGNPQ